MKKIFYLILLMSGLYANAQTTRNDVYDFPIKQGSKQWRTIENIDERIMALQIPNSILSWISTEALLETCLRYPYLTDILFCDNYQKGFEVLTNEFNGFQELLIRPNLIDVLLKKYKALATDMTKLNFLDEVEKGRFTFRHFVVEFMLTQDVIIDNLSPEKEKQLFLLSFEHHKLKSCYQGIFGNLNTIPTNLLYVKKIINDPDFKYENKDQKKIIYDFVQNPTLIDKKIMRNVESHINSIYK